jgi:PQQ-like domain
MSNEARTACRRLAVAGAALVVVAGLIAGCSGSSSSSSTLACPSKRGAAVTGNAPAATGRPAAGWTQPDADLASTRNVASAITSTNVSKLGVAWTVPLTIPTAHTDGAYATTPVIVNGVVYVQDLESDVMAISVATGKVLWTHDYNSPNGGPDGVNVAGRVVYAATAKAAVALDAATGTQLWSRTLIGNDHEGIAMAPGFNHGTVYVSTVPANVTDQRRRVHHHVQGLPVRAQRDYRRHLVLHAAVRREQRAGRRQRRLRHRRRRRRTVQHPAEHDHRLQARGDRQAP